MRTKIDLLRQHLHEISPVSIWYVSQTEIFFGEDKHKGKQWSLGENMNGRYYHGQLILINHKLPFIEAVQTITHEIGHAICYRDKCFCHTSERYIREAHAILYSLHITILWEILPLLNQSLLVVNAYLCRKRKKLDKYRLAAEYVILTDKYKIATAISQGAATIDDYHRLVQGKRSVVNE